MQYKQKWKIFIEPIKTVCLVTSYGFNLEIIITSWAIVFLASGGLAKVEEGERRCQGEKEKSRLSHPQQRNLGWTIIMKDRKHAGAILIGGTSRLRFWLLGESLCCRYLYLKFSHLIYFCKENITLLEFKYTLILGNLSPGYPNGSQQIPAPTHVSEKRSFKYDMIMVNLSMVILLIWFDHKKLLTVTQIESFL